MTLYTVSYSGKCLSSVLISLHRQGISIVKTSDSDLCYVVPTGSKVEDGSHTRSLILNSSNESLEAKTYSLDTQVLPGYIKDTSFVLSELDKECLVYQWMMISTGGKDSACTIHGVTTCFCMRNVDVMAYELFLDVIDGRRVKRGVREICLKTKTCTKSGNCTISISCA